MPSTSIRQNIIAKATRIVVKVGTNAICDQAGKPDQRAISNLAGQIATVMKSGVSVTLVASGASGAGMGELSLSARPKTLPMLQACAAIGQGQLMRTFHDVFARRKVRVAQVLLTRDDFEDRTRYLNIRNTLTSLIDCGVLAIVNENDTVAVDEIRFGDNDVIASLVTTMLGAEVVVFLTGVDGVLKDGEVLDVIERVDEDALALDTGRQSSHGSGGMASKLSAAAIATRAGEVAIIANARTPKVLVRLLAGERLGTCFVPADRKLSSRRRWIAQASRPAGKITIDDGAVGAISKRGKSLLPSGILAVSGRFDKGDTVRIVDESGAEIARGLTNYSAEQIEKIKGMRSSKIEQILGQKDYDEVVHRNNMTAG